MIQILPNVIFRLSKNNEKQNSEIINKTIIFYNDLIKNKVSESNILIINNYLKLWIDFIIAHPILFENNNSHYIEFFTKTSFPDFIINAVAIFEL